MGTSICDAADRDPPTQPMDLAAAPAYTGEGGTFTLSSRPSRPETREQARERGAQTASSSDVVHVPGTTGDELRWYKLGCEDGAEHEATHWKAQLEQVTAERDTAQGSLLRRGHTEAQIFDALGELQFEIGTQLVAPLPRPDEVVRTEPVMLNAGLVQGLFKALRARMRVLGDWSTLREAERQCAALRAELGAFKAKHDALETAAWAAAETFADGEGGCMYCGDADANCTLCGLNAALADLETQ